jgi:hypothetical protein
MQAGNTETHLNMAPMRLYRGMTRPYRMERVDKEKLLMGTDFTDCPMTALLYARGRNGVLLVVDIPEDAEIRISEELWFLDGAGPKRYLLHGAPFDPYIVGQIPAKELRAEIRKKGMGALTEGDKSRVLVDYLKRRILSLEKRLR